MTRVDAEMSVKNDASGGVEQIFSIFWYVNVSEST